MTHFLHEFIHLKSSFLKKGLFCGSKRNIAMIFIKFERILFHLILAVCVFIQCTWAKCTSATIVIICTHNGSRDHLLVSGDSISIADIIKTAPCWSDAKQINIFALNKIFFDADIDKRGQNVNITIFSPTWEIIPSPLTESYTRRHLVRLDTNTEFNFFGMSIEKINRDNLKFQVEGDKNRIRMMVNNSECLLNLYNKNSVMQLLLYWFF